MGCREKKKKRGGGEKERGQGGWLLNMVLEKMDWRGREKDRRGRYGRSYYLGADLFGERGRGFEEKKENLNREKEKLNEDVQEGRKVE